ncbi:hypothetical protein Spock_27 [Bacillus phage Spock]|uniref:Uncharacterized protein n=2 Tax=Bequatrovirus spock TaxID=1918008 RepID=A0A1X9SFM7_9CAUD|nr:hypothetical protein Spock_27 [Bacillus phage Spock]AGY48427.1 hypothetical protein Spock_27 [Bacillus phage Spock]ARQ94942.1 hypothetical protein FLAPJACK_28 [Bacillus phage Flapjack]
MTRYTRNRQMDKLNKNKSKWKKKWKEFRNMPIESMRRIEKTSTGTLDATFKWHRNFEGWGWLTKKGTFNVVEFGGNEDTYGTWFPVKTKGW